MATMKLVRSIDIQAPIDTVYEHLSDFHNWPKWSPWDIMEQGISMNVREDGKYYEWEGKQVGSGNMTVLSEEKNKWVDCDLTFLKPWKSKAKVRFEVKQNGDHVTVDWHMESKLPFFMFWMKNMMSTYVGMDFMRGLRMLKECCEEGQAFSKLEFMNIQETLAFSFIGLRTTTSMDAMAKKMADDMPRLLEFVQANNLEISAPPFTQYHKWAIMKNQVMYSAGIPVAQKADLQLPEGFYWGEMPATKSYTINHIGRYHHLGNAWGTTYMYQRNKVFKANKSVHPFEVYMNNPADTDSKELITRVHIPTK